MGPRSALLTVVAALALALTPAVASAQAEKVLKMGWAQDPQTLSPFIDYDEEDFTVWSLQYDLLVNFSPKDLGPAPGIAESWEVSDDKKTVTYHLIKGAKWSDGQPITSKDVKYSLDVLGGNGPLFTTYVENVESVETPDAETVVVKTKQPDTRMVGGLFLHILPEHVWGKQKPKALTSTFKPKMPMVGSGPFVATEFKRGRIIRMERNPNWRGAQPKFDEIQIIKYGTTDAVERALQLGEIDFVREVQASSFERLSKAKNIKTLQSPSPSFTELAFNLCDEQHCPDAKFNPGVQDVAVRQAIAYAVDRKKINAIATRNTSFEGHGLLPQYYAAFYEQPADDYALDVEKAKQLLDDAGWKPGSGGVREKGGVKLALNLAVRSESPETVQMAKLIAEMTKPIGIDFKVDVMSTDKLTELTVRQVDGKMAPDFDAFIWGWGGDPYDPSVLLGLITSKQIGASSDSFYANPEYDRLYAEQAAEFDQGKRKELVKQLLALAQRDLPYLVLTVDPSLQAYRTDRIGGVSRQCPEKTGDAICDLVSYQPLLTIGPPEAKAASSAAGGDDDGGSSVVWIVVAIVAVALIALALFLRSRRRRADEEPLEAEV
jgi:peptide/nickel transport system substrate-binding protein